MLVKYKNNIPKIGKSVYTAGGAKIIGKVTVGDYSSVWFNAIIRGDVNSIKIGNRTNIQDNCVLHVTNKTAPLNIGNNVTIGHNVVLHGCTIQDNCIIGSGAIIWDGAVIKEGSVVGAGAVVLANFKAPSRSLILGMPAKVKTQVPDEKYAGIIVSADNYVKYADAYLNG